MKTHATTIWESASRPLFVRSVWLEAANAGRSLQRHFILDYEPKDFEKRLKSAVTTARRNKVQLQQSVSYELSECYESTYDQQDELLLISSAKVRFQQQAQQHYNKTNAKLNKNKRRLSNLHKKSHLNGPQQQKRFSEAYQNSRRSSLQDSQSLQASALVNPEERLAERVLHWLDLAGKTEILKQYADFNAKATADTMPDPHATGGTKAKQTKPRRVSNANQSVNNSRAGRQCAAAAQQQQAQQQRTHANATLPQRKTGKPMNRKQNNANNTNVCQHGRPDSIKHITIIFNKDGVPVRLNRPARNIDLCALSSSANTTRRLAGTLASARLYNSAAEKSLGMKCTPGRTQQPLKSPARKNGTVAQAAAAPQTACLHENTACRTIGDARKQLHIFMPCLPKKGMLGGTSVDDANSALSNAFSELCNM